MVRANSKIDPYSKEWLNLVHYQKSLTGYKSEADGEGFFFAKDGKYNPKAELDATIIGLKNTTIKMGTINAPAQCVFPARKKFLEMKGEVFPSIPCPDYEVWRKALNVDKISLVFATAYPNNPASMFGHTFLRLNGPGEGNALLDYAVNFAATTGTSNGLEFALLGVWGGYEGHYSLAPYFLKVNEYNHGEARDLWEYPLHISSEKIDLLLAHLWEIEANTFFDYYFVDENCSWQILRLLEAVDPSFNLSKKAPFYIVPGNTVQILSENNKLGNPVFRPSLRKQYLAEDGIQNEIDHKLLYFRIKERLKKITPQNKIEYHELLTKRSFDTTPTKEIKLEPSQNRPDLGHKLRRVGAMIGDNQKRVSYRFALHDLLDSDIGHENWSQLDVLKLSIEQKEEKIFFREISFLDIISLHPIDVIKFEPSWYLKTGAVTPIEFQCHSCLTAGIHAGAGLTLKSKTENLIAGLFIGGRAYGYSPQNEGPWAGLSTRTLVGFKQDRWKALLNIERIWGSGFNHEFLAELSGSYSINTSWSLRPHASTFLGKNQEVLESAIDILYYY